MNRFGFSIVSLLATLLSILLLSGCGNKSNIKPPEPLKPFVSTIKVHELWANNIGNGNGGLDLSLQPAIHQDTVYAVSNDGEVVASNLYSGKRKWEVQLDSGLSSSPLYCGNKILFGSMSGQFYALDALTGKKLWQASLASSVQVKAACGSDSVIVSTHDGSVAKYELNSGKLLWSQSISIPQLIMIGNSAPIIYKGKVLVGFANGELWAFDYITGGKLWDKTIAVPSGGSTTSQMVDINTTPIESSGMLYTASYQGNLLAFNITSQKDLWVRKFSTYSNMAKDLVNLYAISASSTILAIDRDSGSTVWKHVLLARRSLTAPLVFDKKIIVGDYQGYLHFFNKYTGVYLGRYQLSDVGISAAPRVYKGIIVVQNDKGELFGLKIS
jgi:outer membrane protein assembly factor BamB